MGNEFDDKFLQRFVVIEKNLLALDSSSIGDFNHKWTNLVYDLKVAMDSESLSTTTVRAAHSLANRVSLVIRSFLDLEILAEKLMSSLLDESSPTFNEPPTPPSETSNVSVPSYIKPSYDWLVQNIHNPYPSSEIRDVIARKSGAARKDVNHWFMAARKRIGWNDTRKTYFANRRADMIDAATRFYSNDEKLSLSQGAEHALISVMKNTKDLYNDKFNETVLAIRLDAAVKDLTPQAKAEQLHQLQLRKARDSYPSPEQSPEPSHPSPSPCNDEVDNIASQAIASHKRRVLSIESVEISQSKDIRPTKRSRFDVSSSEGTVPFIALPSPTTSIDEFSQVLESSTPSSPFSSSRSSRKRRLSQSDDTTVPKRPRELPSAPRLQTVSDPLPLSGDLLFNETSFDGWFQQIFDHPDVERISPSGVSVELCNLSEFETPAISQIGQASKSPLIEVADVPNLLDVPWNGFDLDMFAPSDAMSHSSLLIDFVEKAPFSIPLAQDVLNTHGASRELHLSDNFGTSLGLSKYIVDCDVNLPNPVSSETWDFSTSALPNDGACDFKKHHVDFLEGSDELLVTLNFPGSTDFSPSPNIAFPTLTQDEIRQEKVKEFREACEKAQRLASELQKDNLFAS